MGYDLIAPQGQIQENRKGGSRCTRSVGKGGRAVSYVPNFASG